MITPHGYNQSVGVWGGVTFGAVDSGGGMLGKKGRPVSVLSRLKLSLRALPPVKNQA